MSARSSLWKKLLRRGVENWEYMLTVSLAPQTLEIQTHRTITRQTPNQQLLTAFRSTHLITLRKRGGVGLSRKVVAWTQSCLSTAESQTPAAKAACGKMLYHRKTQEPRNKQRIQHFSPSLNYAYVQTFFHFLAEAWAMKMCCPCSARGEPFCRG